MQCASGSTEANPVATARSADAQIHRSLLLLASATAIAICIFVLWQSTGDFLLYQVSDLRNRITGARRLVDAIDPYRPLSPQVGEYYRAWSPTSITPAHLLLYVPLRRLPYSSQRTIYYIVDWVTVLAIFAAIGRLTGNRVPLSLVFFCFAALFILDTAFRLEIARGQCYLQFVLLAAVASCGLKKANPGWLAGLALAILLVIRPTYFVVVAALFILGCRKFLVKVSIMFALLVTTIVSLTGISVWKSYARMVRQEMHLHFESAALGGGQRSQPATPDPPIEGYDRSRFLRVNEFEHDRTFAGLFTFPSWHTLLSRDPSSALRQLRVVNDALLLMCAAAGLSLTVWIRDYTDPLVRIAFVLLLPIDLETFGPQRIAYSDVLLAFPLILLACSAVERLLNNRKRRGWPVPLVLFGAFAFAASSRTSTSQPIAGFSVTRFFIALAAAHACCLLMHRKSIPQGKGHSGNILLTQEL